MPSQITTRRARRAALTLAPAAVLISHEVWRVQRESRRASKDRQRRVGPSPAPAVADQARTVVTSDGVELAVAVYRPRGAAAQLARPDDPVVVLVHGYTLDSHSWVLLLPVLVEQGWTVITYDQRGHGDSDRGAWDSYTFDRLAEDLAQVITECAPGRKVVLGGHSMGGMTMLALGRNHQQLVHESVAGAAFIATAADGMTDRISGVPSYLARLLATMYQAAPAVLYSFGSRSRSLRWALSMRGPLGRALVYRHSFGHPVPVDVLEQTARMIFGTPLSVIAAVLPAFGDLDHYDACDAFCSMPCLIFHGDADLLTPQHHGDRLAEALPDARHVCIPGAGHVVMLEQPEKMGEEMLALLERAREIS